MRPSSKNLAICLVLVGVGVLLGYLGSYAASVEAWHGAADIVFSFLAFVLSLFFWIAHRLDLHEEESYLEDQEELAHGFDFTYASDAVKQAARRSV